jgi:DNA-binding CsgD family transcriptional regulator
VSTATVDKHRWKIFEKMRVDNVVELVRLLHDGI